MNSSSENTAHRTVGLGQQLRDALRIVFALDLRSLAAFRIGMGFLIVCDLLFRSRSLTAMYTDDGFFTRQVSYDYYQSTWGDGWNTIFWSLHWLGGSPEFIATMFVIAGLFAMLLIVGKWTRVATVISWVLLVSLHVRNPVIISSADFLLKLMLFWSLFLPLGRVWSLDAITARKRGLPPANRHVPITNFATAGLIIQLVVMYFFTGIAKWNEGWWTGEAMYHCLGLDIYVTPAGRQLLQFPLLLKFISVATVFAEVFLIWTLFIAKHNGRLRLMNMAVFWMFHIGIAVSMSIGLFSWICMVAWIPLLPGFVWNALRSKSGEANEVAEPVRRSVVYWLQQAFCALLILFVIGWNVANIEQESIRKYVPKWMVKIGFLTRLDQHFQMFGQPPRSNPGFVYEAVLQDGNQIDLLTGRGLSADQAKSMQEVLPSFHWRKLHRNLVSEFHESLRKPLAEYWMRHWNDEHPDNRVSRLRLMYHEEDTGSDAIESNNQYSKVWVTLRDEKSGAGSLFEQVKKGDDNDPLKLGF